MLKRSVVIVVLAALAVSAPAAHAHRKKPKHQPQYLTLKRGETAIMGYAKRDHPQHTEVRDCHRVSRLAISCIVKEDEVLVLFEGRWVRESTTYGATANLLVDNTILIESTRQPEP